MIKANTRISQAISCRPWKIVDTYQTANMPIMEISQRKKSDICKQKNPFSNLCLLQIYHLPQAFATADCGFFRFLGACRGGCSKVRLSGKKQRKSTCEAVLWKKLYRIFGETWKNGQRFFIFPRHSERHFELKNSEFRCEIKFWKSLHLQSEKLRILFNTSQIKFFINWKYPQTVPDLITKDGNAVICFSGVIYSWPDKEKLIVALWHPSCNKKIRIPDYF